MLLTSATKSRRCFLQSATWLGATLCFSTGAAAGRDEPDPFDALPKSVWANARRNGLVMIHRPVPTSLSEHSQIVGANEPGDRLIVEGQVFGPDGRTPLEGITVYAYNTDAEGYYSSDHKEYPPRLYGWMKTGVNGRFKLHTIHPGHYPGMRVPAHVHFTVWGRGYPPQWVEELQFEGDRYLTREMLAEAAGEAEFSSIRPLRRTEEGVLHCSYKIRIQSETNFR